MGFQDGGEETQNSRFSRDMYDGIDINLKRCGSFNIFCPRRVSSVQDLGKSMAIIFARKPYMWMGQNLSPMRQHILVYAQDSPFIFSQNSVATLRGSYGQC